MPPAAGGPAASAAMPSAGQVLLHDDVEVTEAGLKGAVSGEGHGGAAPATAASKFTV